MSTINKLLQSYKQLSEKEQSELIEAFKLHTIQSKGLNLEDIIKSGQIAEETYMFLTANNTYIYEDNKLTAINDRYAIATISQRFNDIKVSPYLLSKLPKFDIVFNPQATEKIYDGKFNTFTASQYVLYSKEIKERFSLDINYVKKEFKHIYLLLQNIFKNDEYISYFINWFSTIINIRQKMGVAFIIKGSQGTGKNFLFDHLIKKAFYVSDNAEYTTIVDNDRLRNKFNGWLEQSLFVCFNEIKGDFRDNATTADSLKSLITDSKIQIERKGRDSQELHTFFNSIMFSNHSIPFQVEPGDRRFFVIETNNKKLDNVVRDELNISMSDYVNNFDEESHEFLKYIISIKYDVSKARTALNTREKDALIDATTPRLTRFSHLVKNQDIVTLFNEFQELYSNKDMPLNLFNQSLKAFLNDVKRGRLAISSLKFAYEHYVNMKNDKTKVERDLTGEFGKSLKSSGHSYKKLSTTKSIDIDIDELFLNSSLTDSIVDSFSFDVNDSFKIIKFIRDEFVENGYQTVFTNNDYTKIYDEKNDSYDYLPIPSN